jgi:hypothetical protein
MYTARWLPWLLHYFLYVSLTESSGELVKGTVKQTYFFDCCTKLQQMVLATNFQEQNSRKVNNY